MLNGFSAQLLTSPMHPTDADVEQTWQEYQVAVRNSDPHLRWR